MSIFLTEIVQEEGTDKPEGGGPRFEELNSDGTRTPNGEPAPAEGHAGGVAGSAPMSPPPRRHRAAIAPPLITGQVDWAETYHWGTLARDVRKFLRSFCQQT